MHINNLRPWTIAFEVGWLWGLCTLKGDL